MLRKLTATPPMQANVIVKILIFCLCFFSDVSGGPLRLLRPFAPLLAWYGVANLPIYGIGEWHGKAEGLGAMTDFSTLVNRLPPPAIANEYIVAPRGVAPRARVVDPGISFDVTPDELFKISKRAILRQDLVTLVAQDDATLRLEVVQRTPLLRFPDVITVQPVSVGQGKSSIAMHSYSIYGAGDLGTNKKRVLSFIEAIKSEASSSTLN